MSRRKYATPNYATQPGMAQAQYNQGSAVEQLGQNFLGLNVNQNGQVDPNSFNQPGQQNANYDYSYGAAPFVNGNIAPSDPSQPPYSPYGGYDSNVATGGGGTPLQQGGAGGYGFGSTAGQFGGAAQESLPLNQLYTTDLLKDLPPSIDELSLPPPPIILPSNATINPHTGNAQPEYLRSTLNVVPSTHSLLRKSKLPFALCIRPYVALREEDEPVPVATDTIISRCRRCRGYINPFVTFPQQQKWRCNFCGLQNDVPQAYDYDEISQTAQDRYKRLELNNPIVEFVAPKEYMAHAPSALMYCFFIDVSEDAINSGMTSTVVRTILENLDGIPNRNETTKICIVGVDSSLHFFRFKEGLSEMPELLIVSDLEVPYAPTPDGLFINLSTNRKAIEQLLEVFPTLFENTANPFFALGPALRFGFLMLQNGGGKLMVFSSNLPNTGEGKLTIRDEASAGKAKDSHTLMRAADKFYKSFAVQCSAALISIDMFLTGSKYQDVASLSNLLRYTAGQTHFYPSWKSDKEEDVHKLAGEISKHLSMQSALEAVLRVRCSTGFRTSQFYGNFFNRSSDLCSFPFFPRDQGYVIEVSIEENTPKPVVYFQAATLHTTCYGQRRIRVINLALPTSSKLEDIYASADQLAITNFYAHISIAKALDSSLANAREFLIKSVADLLVVYRKELASGNVTGSLPLQLSTNLRMLPLLLFSLTKHAGFKEQRSPADHRAIALNNLGSWPLNQLIRYIYPTVYSLHNMTAECGMVERVTQINEEIGEEETVDGEILLPVPINDSNASWEKYGLYLIDTGSELFLWVSGSVVPDLVVDLFGVGSLFEITTGKTELPVLLPEESFEFNYRVRNIIKKIRELKGSIIWKSLYVVIGGSSAEPIEVTQRRDLMALRHWALSFLVEDKNQFEPGYRDFLTNLTKRVTT